MVSAKTVPKVPMKIFCCYTPAHEILFQEYFRPSLPEGWTLQTHRLEISGAGDFLSPEFLRCIREKIRLIQTSITENWGEWIVWSDVDIVFCSSNGLQSDPWEQEPGDLFFQRENARIPDVNTGFVVIRCGRATADFFGRVAAGLERDPSKNEQAIVNELLAQGDPVRWSYLPRAFYARTQGWPPPRKAVLYHANYTKGADGVGQKIAQFKEWERLRRGGVFALVASCLRRVPGALGRRISFRK